MSIEKRVMRILLPRCSKDHVTWAVLGLYKPTSRQGLGGLWLGKGRDLVAFIWDQLLLLMRPAWDSDMTLLCFTFLSSEVRPLWQAQGLPSVWALANPGAHLVQSCGSIAFTNHTSPWTGITGIGWRTPKADQDSHTIILMNPLQSFSLYTLASFSELPWLGSVYVLCVYVYMLECTHCLERILS